MNVGDAACVEFVCSPRIKVLFRFSGFFPQSTEVHLRDKWIGFFNLT